MADDNESADGSQEEGSLELEEEGKKSGKKKIILLLIIVLVLVGGGVGVFMSGILGGGEAEQAAADEQGGALQDDMASEPGGPDNTGAKSSASGEPMPSLYFYELPEFLVNLNSGDTRRGFLKMSISIEVENEDAMEKLQEFQPRIQDAFQTYLRQLRPSDLQGSAGLYRLREELMLRLNKAVYPVEVNDILFKEIIVQ